MMKRGCIVHISGTMIILAEIQTEKMEQLMCSDRILWSEHATMTKGMFVLICYGQLVGELKSVD